MEQHCDEQHHRLNIVDVVDAHSVKLAFHHLEKSAMKTLDEGDHIEICVVHSGLVWRLSLKCRERFMNLSLTCDTEFAAEGR